MEAKDFFRFLWSLFIKPEEKIKSFTNSMIEREQKKSFENAKKLSDFVGMVSRLLFLFLFNAGLLASISESDHIDNIIINSIIFKISIFICFLFSIQITIRMLISILSITFWHYVLMIHNERNFLFRLIKFIVGLFSICTLLFVVIFCISVIVSYQPSIMNLLKPFLDRFGS